MTPRISRLCWWPILAACVLMSCQNGRSGLQLGDTTSSTRAFAASPREPIAEPETAPPDAVPVRGEKVTLSEDEWRERLSEEQFHILRERGTERPWTGRYLKDDREGTYHCAGCNNPLFSSETKFDSRTGWPSFWAPVHEQRVETRIDRSHGLQRVEIVCAVCGGHLGHVFQDGPEPTGLRYCVNSAALYFRPAK